MSQPPTPASPALSLAMDSSDDNSLDTRSVSGNESDNEQPLVYNVVTNNNNGNLVINVNNNGTYISGVTESSESESSDEDAVAELPEVTDMSTYYHYLQNINGVMTATPEQNNTLQQHERNHAVDTIQSNTSNNVIDVDAKQSIVYPFDTSMSYTWRIPHFPLLRNRIQTQMTSKKLLSDTFTLCNHEWKLMLFPVGNNQMPMYNTRRNTNISIFVQEQSKSDNTTKSPSINVHFAFAVVNNDNTSESYHKEGTNCFGPGDDRGFNEFVSNQHIDQYCLQQPDDALIIQCLIEPVIDPPQRIHTLPNYSAKLQTGYVGLKNQGATCYMNSLLQALYHVPQFRVAVYSMPIPPVSDTEKSKKSISLALQRVFYQLQTSQQSVSTKQLTSSFGWDSLDAFMQHDVQEFSRVLIDSLEETIKKSETNLDKHVINRLFEGKSESYIKCINVDYKSSRVESFMDLAVNVKGCTNLQQSLDQYVTEEKLTGENQYRAAEFGKQDAVKGVRFVELPNVLQIQLKRFEYDPQRDSMTKIHDRFAFPTVLDMSKYIDSDTINKDDPPIYYLQSVLIHVGNVNGGHYYSFIRPLTKLPPDQSPWIKFDDDTVYCVDENEAIEQSYGGEYTTPSKFKGMKQQHEQKRTRTSSAYMLIYLRQSACIWTEQATEQVNESKPVQNDTDMTVPVTQAVAAANEQTNHTGTNDSKHIENGTIDIPHTNQHVNTTAITTQPTSDITSTHINVVIPIHLRERFEQEACDIAEQKCIKAQLHLYMRVVLIREPYNMRVGNELSVERLDTQLQIRYDVIEHYINVKKDDSIESAAAEIERLTSIPIQYQEYYSYENRQNDTYRVNHILNKQRLFKSLMSQKRGNEDGYMYVRDNSVDTKYNIHLFSGLNDIAQSTLQSNSPMNSDTEQEFNAPSPMNHTTRTPSITPQHNDTVPTPPAQQSADSVPSPHSNVIPPLPMPALVPPSPPHTIDPTFLLFKFFNIHTQSLHCIASGHFASNLTIVQLKQYIRHVLRVNNMLPAETKVVLPPYHTDTDTTIDHTALINKYLDGKDAAYENMFHIHLAERKQGRTTEFQSEHLNDDEQRYTLHLYDEENCSNSTNAIRLTPLHSNTALLYGDQTQHNLGLISGDIIVFEFDTTQDDVNNARLQWLHHKQQWDKQRQQLLHELRNNQALSIDSTQLQPCKEKFCATAKEYYNYMRYRIVLEIRSLNQYNMDEHGKPVPGSIYYHIEVSTVSTLKQIYEAIATAVNNDTDNPQTDVDSMKIRLHRHIYEPFGNNKFGHCDADSYISKNVETRFCDLSYSRSHDEIIFYYTTQQYSWLDLVHNRQLDIIFVDQQLQQYSMSLLCPKDGHVSDLQYIAYQQYQQILDTTSSVRSSPVHNQTNNTTVDNTVTTHKRKNTEPNTTEQSPVQSPTEHKSISPHIDDEQNKRRRVQQNDSIHTADTVQSPGLDSMHNVVHAVPDMSEFSDSDSSDEEDDDTQLRHFCNRNLRTDLILNIQHQRQPITAELKNIWDLFKSTIGLKVRVELLSTRDAELSAVSSDDDTAEEKLVWVVPFRKINAFNPRQAPYKLLDLPFMITVQNNDTTQAVIYKIAERLHITDSQRIAAMSLSQLTATSWTDHSIYDTDEYSSMSDTDETKQEQKLAVFPWDLTYHCELDEDDQPSNTYQIIGFVDAQYKDRSGTSTRRMQQAIKINT